MDPEFVPVGYEVYKNVFKYIKIKKYNVIEDKTNIDSKNLAGTPNTLKKYTKTIQFHQYVRIKAINEKKEILYVFIIEDPFYVSRVSMFMKLINTITESKCNMLVLSSDEMKKTIKKFLGSYKKKDITFRDLGFDYFKIDPRNHILVPLHKLCTPEEVTKILAYHHLDDVSQLPQIKYADPQVVWVDGEIGDVIEIHSSDLNTVSLKYRVVTL